MVKVKKENFTGLREVMRNRFYALAAVGLDSYMQNMSFP